MYGDARRAVKGHRGGKIAALLGETAQSWFTSAWGSIREMLGAFKSDDENAAISGLYVSGTVAERMKAHMRHDYVCGIRREVRKQYVSGESDVYTDVTPFRHGVLSAHGAILFDDVLNQIIGGEGKK